MTTSAAVNTLTFSVEHKGDTALVHCRGRLVTGLCGNFHDKMKPLFAESKRVILDLTDLESVDSMGLGLLVRLHVTAKAAGSCLELINLNKKVRDLLGITNLLSIFGDMCEKGVTVKY
jgi:anti-sigma B factor antagonist